MAAVGDRSKRAGASDIAKLGELSAEPWCHHGSERHLLFGDAGVAAIFIATFLLIVVQALVEARFCSTARHASRCVSLPRCFMTSQRRWVRTGATPKTR
jgi:hypothetical protein